MLCDLECIVLLNTAGSTPLASSRRSAALLELSVDQLVMWGVLYYSYSVLSVPIARDLEVSPRAVAGAFSTTLLVAALLARPVGRALDHVGAQTVLRVGAVLAPLTFAALAGVQTGTMLLATFGALGVAHALALYEPAFRAVVDWFPQERERSRALLVLTSVAGFASTLFVPFTAALVHRFGWRTAVVILAVIIGAVVIPVRFALPAPRRAESRHEHRSPAHVASHNGTWNMVGAAFALQSFAATGATVCLVWHLVDTGRSLQTAAFVAGLVGASQVPGRLVLMPLQRALRTEHRLPLLFIVEAVALGGIAVGSTPLMTISVLLFGAAGGMMTLERATVTLEWFGRERFGARSGHIASIAFLARATSPYAVEFLHGSTSYAGVLGVLAFGLVGAGAVIVYAHRVRADTRGCGRRY